METRTLLTVRIAILLMLLSLQTAAEPLVIAHRGASGYYPEHTLEAYRAAMEMGADYIEPDLVLTRDGVLIARHDIFLGTTTNVAEVFPDRRSSADGKSEWYVSDFTISEIRQLSAVQSYGNRSREYDGQFGVPALADVIALVREVEKSSGRQVGIYPELKAPAYFAGKGFNMGQLLLDELEKHTFEAKVLIQSFDPEALKSLDGKTTIPLVMLLTPQGRENFNTPNIPLEEVAGFADGIGAFKYLLINRQGGDAGVVSRAHDLGLFVHAWTFRDDNLPPFATSAEEEIRLFLSLGVDGFFTDFPDTGVKVRDSFRQAAP